MLSQIDKVKVDNNNPKSLEAGVQDPLKTAASDASVPDSTINQALPLGLVSPEEATKLRKLDFPKSLRASLELQTQINKAQEIESVVSTAESLGLLNEQEAQSKISELRRQPDLSERQKMIQPLSDAVERAKVAVKPIEAALEYGLITLKEAKTLKPQFIKNPDGYLKKHLSSQIQNAKYAEVTVESATTYKMLSNDASTRLTSILRLMKSDEQRSSSIAELKQDLLKQMVKNRNTPSPEETLSNAEALGVLKPDQAALYRTFVTQGDQNKFLEPIEVANYQAELTKLWIDRARNLNLLSEEGERKLTAAGDVRSRFILAQSYNEQIIETRIAEKRIERDCNLYCVNAESFRAHSHRLTTSAVLRKLPLFFQRT
jgi:hypothetical protein